MGNGTDANIEGCEARNETLRNLLRSINGEIAKMEETGALHCSRHYMMPGNSREERTIPGNAHEQPKKK